MNELQAAAGVLTSLKTAFDLSKAMMDVAGAVKIQGQIFELQREILSAQSSAMDAQTAQTALLRQIDGLEQEIVRLKDWSAEKQSYELKAVDAGAFAYMKKPGMEGGEDPHWLCANCFGNGQKAVMQYQKDLPPIARTWLAKWQCGSCKSEFSVSTGRKPHIPFAAS